LKDRLEKIEGVASCSISGGIEREIQVNVSEGALQASDISLTEIVSALRDSNLNYPAGTTEEEFFEWLIRTMGEFKAVSDIDATVITIDDEQKNDYTAKRDDENALKRRRAIKLSDIAVIKDSFKEKTSYSRYNGKENVSVAIQRQAEANTILTVQKVMKELKKIEEILPENARVDIVYDQSKFIKNAIGGVTDAAWQGGLLAILVLLFFLMNVKDSLIVATTIPISIIGTFCLMYFSGITINMLSLGGLAMGVGMLVDGAIVVLENIFRHRDDLHEDIVKSAEIGTDEMVGAVSASTLTTVAVFLPMIFIIGVAGQIFKELALTITYSLLVSTVIAFTLIPRLVITGKAGGISHLKVFAVCKEWLKNMSDFYARTLKNFLAHKGKGLGIIFLTFVLSLCLLMAIGKEFMPKVDEGQFLIKLDMSAGTKLDVTNEITRRVEQVILGMKYVKTVSATVGSNKEESTSAGSVEMLQPSQAQIVISLQPKRNISTDKFIQDLKNKLDSVETEGAEINYILSQNVIFSAFQEGGAPVVIEVKGAELDKLDTIGQSIVSEVSKIKGVYNVKNSMKEPAPETKIIVNRDKAALYNLSVHDIARIAQIAIDGWVATKFKEEGREIDIRVRLREADRKDFAAVKQLRIISPNGTEISLDEVTDLKLGKGPSEIKRIDKERTILVSANIFNRNINDVIKEVTAALAKVDIPSGYPKPKLTGEQEQMKESFNSLVFVLILSIFLVYMVMAAQFESLWQPFLIMFTVPLSIIGVAIALFLTGTTINVISILGVIILGGIVVNNGIVLIDCMNVLRKEGKSIYDAAVEASAMRLRPVLMTALTTILGLIPLALGIGEGSEMQSPLAITVMGGMTVATFLTLIVIPAIYIVTEEFFARRRVRPIA
jgi:hydrophobic/amphiphilic exporter-1 (mainly G- bacteria), HAE1 family